MNLQHVADLDDCARVLCELNLFDPFIANMKEYEDQFDYANEDEVDKGKDEQLKKSTFTYSNRIKLIKYILRGSIL